MRDRISFLQQCVARGSADIAHDVQHRASFAADAPASSNRSDQPVDLVTTLFEQQEGWHNSVRKVKWEQLPHDPKVPLLQGFDVRPSFLIVHLFSGRRRQQDVHWHLMQAAATRGLKIAVLSMDTAVSPYLGNLESQSESWSQLARLYEQGHVAASICGAPCETFSAARHVPPPEDLTEADKRRWPRPLRSFAQLFGLCGLRPKELRQCKQGSAFMLQAVMVCIWHVLFGGLYLSEHPAPPADDKKASIWTSAIISLLRQHPDIQLKLFDQWKWGAHVKKPTGLLGLRLPYLHKSMYACADLEAKFPQQTAIGKDELGCFRTAACKEYPSLFSAGLARSIIDQLCTDVRNGACRSSEFISEDGSLRQWLSEALLESSRIRVNSSFLPDYQGK